MRVLQIVKGPLGNSGIAQIAWNFAECFAEAGHESWLHIFDDHVIHAKYHDRLGGIIISTKKRFAERLLGRTKGFELTKSYDLVIHHVPRKSWRNAPNVEGPKIVFVYTPSCGYQSYNLDADRVFFPSHYMKKHLVDNAGTNHSLTLLDPRHNNPDREDTVDSWRKVQKWPSDKWDVMYPPINENAFNRRVRSVAEKARQLTLPRKIHPEWRDIFENEVGEIIDFVVVSGGINSYEDRSNFWDESDVVLWCETYDTGFGLNQYEGMFAGCVPVTLERRDASTELARQHNFGFTFNSRMGLLRIIQDLLDKPELVNDHSTRGLNATRELTYGPWYETFMRKIGDLL